MSRPHRAASMAALLVAAVAAGCGNRGPEREPPEPGPDGAVGSDAVLVRGRIAPDTLVLEPAILVPGGRGDAPDAGPHRIRGMDDHGQPLFDLRFAGAEVADLPRGAEEHFQLVVPVGDGGALTLARLELLAGDGRETVRQARLSASDMRTAVMDDQVVTAQALDEQHVRVRWDPALFPLVIVRDGETGQVLAFGTGGEATVTAGGPTIGIAASEGVRSAVRTLRVR